MPSAFRRLTCCSLAVLASGLLAAQSAPATPALTPEVRGDIFMARKMFREALDAYSTGAERDAVLANKRGIAFHQLQELNAARREYDRAVKLKPDYAEAHNNLGTVAYAQKSYRRAIKHYRKALRLAPKSASIHSNLGTAFFARKKYKEAIGEYELALSLDPEVFEHRGSAGVLLQERSVEERAKYHYHLAKLYAKRGQHELAISYVRKALEEGFKEREKFEQEDDFTQLRENPEFRQLLKQETRVL